MRKVIKGKRPPDARIEAMQLLGQWTSLGQAHVLLGGGCSCGLAAGSLRLEEFEQQILDFLHGYLARFKWPKDIRVVEELPHHVTGKVLRRALRRGELLGADEGPP